MTKQQEKLKSLLSQGFKLQFNKLHGFYFVIVERAKGFRIEKAVYFSENFVNSNNIS